MFDLIEPDEALIRPTAARYAHRFRMVERDDIAQELRVWWLTHQKQIRRYVEQGQERRITKSLQRAAERYCRKVKSQVLGYRPEDEFFYNTGLIRELLPMVWNADLITQDQHPDEGGKVRRSKPANEGNDLLAMVGDVARTLMVIDKDEYAALWMVYGPLKADYSELAKGLGITVAAAKMRVQRAVQSIVDMLGGESPYSDGPGSRKAMSNAAAQALTANQETG